MQIVLTLRTYLVDDLQNPHIKIPIWQDTHIYETQISGVTVLQKVYEVHVVYKQGPTGLGCDIKFIEKSGRDLMGTKFLLYLYICQICCLRLGLRSSGFTHD